jgi:hypothetical protein
VVALLERQGGAVPLAGPSRVTPGTLGTWSDDFQEDDFQTGG